MDPQKVILISGLESSFKEDAVSSTKATDLGQFVAGTFAERIAKSRHPELRALRGLSREELLEKRKDPRIGALALAEHIKDAEDRVKSAFKANGIRDNVTLADI
ncbi:lytic transglycosylase domain-containing protein, partial [Acinetobacter baumannii]